MKEIDVSSFLLKAEEFKALFILGQRIIPFLEEVLQLVQEINPILTDINDSITENLKSMPIAAQHLTKVTEATELASNEILNLVDRIIIHNETLINNMSTVYEEHKKRRESYEEFRKMISEAAKAHKDIPASMVEYFINSRFDSSADQLSVFDNSIALLNEISTYSTSIMMSLQVQDITAQQIAAVNHMLGNIQVKLSGLLQKFSAGFDESARNNQKEKEEVNVTHMHRDIAFDPHAIDNYGKLDYMQNDIDNIINEHNAKMSEGNTENDIDNIINEHNAKMSEGNTEKVPETASEEVPAGDTFSQDDIDSLFAGSGSN